MPVCYRRWNPSSAAVGIRKGRLLKSPFCRSASTRSKKAPPYPGYDHASCRQKLWGRPSRGRTTPAGSSVQPNYRQVADPGRINANASIACFRNSSFVKPSLRQRTSTCAVVASVAGKNNFPGLRFVSRGGECDEASRFPASDLRRFLLSKLRIDLNPLCH